MTQDTDDRRGLPGCMLRASLAWTMLKVPASSHLSPGGWESVPTGPNICASFQQSLVLLWTQ